MDAARLSHDYVVPVFDAGVQSGVPHFIREWIRGGTLVDVLRRRGPRLPPAAGMGMVRDVASGFARAHDHGVIHRDLKPANILLEDTRSPCAPGPAPLEAPRPRIADFGMARGVDTISDVYSLGSVLHCLVTGHRPYESSTPKECLLRKVRCEGLAGARATRAHEALRGE